VIALGRRVGDRRGQTGDVARHQPFRFGEGQHLTHHGADPGCVAGRVPLGEHVGAHHPDVGRHEAVRDAADTGGDELEDPAVGLDGLGGQLGAEPPGEEPVDGAGDGHPRIGDRQAPLGLLKGGAHLAGHLDLGRPREVPTGTGAVTGRDLHVPTPPLLARVPVDAAVSSRSPARSARSSRPHQALRLVGSTAGSWAAAVGVMAPCGGGCTPRVRRGEPGGVARS
jgi:hypothetical protein